MQAFGGSFASAEARAGAHGRDVPCHRAGAFFLTQILFFFLDSTRMKEGAVYLSFLSKS
jgi:hypothetical protein